METIPTGSDQQASKEGVTIQSNQQLNEARANGGGRRIRGVVSLLSVAVALQRGFLTVLIFCAGVLLGAFFLKDVPLARNFHDESAESAVEDEAHIPSAVV